MGAEWSCQEHHSEHGLHFEAEAVVDPSGALNRHSNFIIVEFNGLALTDPAGKCMAFMSYKRISGWAHSQSNHRLTLRVQGNSGREAEFAFRVRDASAIEAAMLARIEVFLDENMFHAIPLQDPSGRMSEEEVTLEITARGITVVDPQGEQDPIVFLFARMESWGKDSSGTVLVIKTPSGVYQFSTEHAAVICRKLTDIAHMILHAEHGHTGSHSAGAPPPTGQGQWSKVELLQDPVGVGLPESCLLRVVDDSCRITGRGTKDALQINIPSLAGWSANGSQLLLKLIDKKGGGVFVFDTRVPHVAKQICATLTTVATAMAERKRAPPPPPAPPPLAALESHPPREAASVESKETKTIRITIPKGTRAGNTITINDPDLGQVKVKVPEGMRAGNLLTVNLNKPSSRRRSIHDMSMGHAPAHNNDGDSVVKVTIPKKVKPGQTMLVNLPNGKGKLKVKVPANAKPGQTLSIKLPNSNGGGGSDSSGAGGGGAKSPQPPPPPPAVKIKVSVPQGAEAGTQLRASYKGNSFMITVPEGARPGTVLNVTVPSSSGNKPRPPQSAATSHRPPPPPLADGHKLRRWPAASVSALRSTLGPDLGDHDLIELLDAADGDVNRAVNFHLETQQRQKSKRRSMVQVARSLPSGPAAYAPMAVAVAAPGVPPPPPPTPPPPPPADLGAAGASVFRAAAGGAGAGATQRSSGLRQDIHFPARATPTLQNEFGFPENVVLSLHRGHFTVSDEDGDDHAAWPMAHVHDWEEIAGGLRVHVPEGVLEFGMPQAKVTEVLTKLATVHAALT